ncbi:MAG TPA: hypothetical protein VF593_03640 [Chthoniobacteraceae bacterium]|jgi:hypothetical protein
MRTNFFLLLTTCASAGAWAAESALPSSFPPSRYDRMVEKSPFALATPVVAPVIAEKNFADRWSITGLAQVDGQNFVTIKSHGDDRQFSLFGNEETKDGIKIQSVEWSPVPRRSTVTIVKGGELAKLEFNPESEAAPGSLAAQQANGALRAGTPQTVRPQGSGPLPMPGSSSANRIPRPGGVPGQIVPNTGNIAQPPARAPGSPTYPVVSGQTGTTSAAGAAASAPPVEGRRRIKVINNNPAAP